MEKLLVVATFLLVVATFILVGVTYWYAKSTKYIAAKTGDAAQAAKQSAESAEKLVKVEQRKAMLASVPRLVLHHMGHDGTGVNLRISNTQGTGCARGLKCYARRASAFGNGLQQQPCTVQGVPYELAAGKQHDAKVLMQLPAHQQGLVILCHYTDLHSTVEEPRIYHSIYVHPQGAVGPPGDDYFPPERPMADNPEFREFVSLCKACGG